MVSYSPKLPNEPIFRRLVENNETLHNVIVHDPSCGVDAKYPQLLQDILALRKRLYKCLPASMFDEKGRIKEDNPYILVLSRGNYEFIVAAFAVLAMGGALVPLGERVIFFLPTFSSTQRNMNRSDLNFIRKDPTFYLKKPYTFYECVNRV